MMTYWTAFAVKGHYPREVHCTHKYLGELEPWEAEELMRVLERWFFAYPFQPFSRLFTRRRLFKDQRVLLPVFEPVMPIVELDGLRARLDCFRADDFAHRPHITTRESFVWPRFDRYVLVRGGETFRTWWPRGR